MHNLVNDAFSQAHLTSGLDLEAKNPPDKSERYTAG